MIIFLLHLLTHALSFWPPLGFFVVFVKFVALIINFLSVSAFFSLGPSALSFWPSSNFFQVWSYLLFSSFLLPHDKTLQLL